MYNWRRCTVKGGKNFKTWDFSEGAREGEDYKLKVKATSEVNNG